MGTYEWRKQNESAGCAVSFEKDLQGVKVGGQRSH